MDVGIPIQITVRKDPDHLQITRTWFERKYVWLTPFVVVWDAFIFWGCKKTFSAAQIDLFVVLFLPLFVCLAVFLTYMWLAGFLNKTKIDVTRNVISVKHGPVPVWGNKRISSRELSRLDYKSEKWRNGIYWIDLISVLAKMSNQSSITLLSGLKDVNQAMFIKQEVESFLGVEGMPK